ncbi:hypothetical protein KJE20_12252 [Pyrenophora tritici-repentis]|nr:hypothetical protein KJE20_12252 [Pyrenophora tritici-repentis]
MNPISLLVLAMTVTAQFCPLRGGSGGSGGIVHLYATVPCERIGNGYQVSSETSRDLPARLEQLCIQRYPSNDVYYVSGAYGDKQCSEVDKQWIRYYDGKWIPAEEPMTNIPFVEKRNCQYEWGVSAWVPFNNGKLGNIGCFYEKSMRKVVIDYTSSCCPPPWKEDIESEEQSIINSLDAGFDPESDLNDDIYSGGGWSVDTSTWESLHQK